MDTLQHLIGTTATQDQGLPIGRGFFECAAKLAPSAAGVGLAEWIGALNLDFAEKQPYPYEEAKELRLITSLSQSNPYVHLAIVAPTPCHAAALGCNEPFSQCPAVFSAFTHDTSWLPVLTAAL